MNKVIDRKQYCLYKWPLIYGLGEESNESTKRKDFELTLHKN